jgi:hypothetical protein
MELDSDIVDSICRCSLKDHIMLHKQSIEKLRQKKKLTQYQKEDLGNQINTLDCLEVVYDYFGGDTAG